MTKIIVDQDRCTQCGICTAVCPSVPIFEADETSLPQVLEKLSPFCINCEHCAIFCPAGALTLDYQSGEKKDAAIVHDGIAPEGLGLYLKARRSVRNFKSQKVNKETILQMLDTARYAASGCNSQPVAWTVVYDELKVQKIAGLTIDWMRHLYEIKDPMGIALKPVIAAWDRGVDAICWNAPHLLVAHIPESRLIAPVGPTDGIISLTHFDILAPAFGIGTCWAGFLTIAAGSWKPLQEALALPEGRMISYAMMFGYPKYKAYRLPRRNPLNVTWL